MPPSVAAPEVLAWPLAGIAQPMIRTAQSGGRVADYIPELAKADASHFGLAVATVGTACVVSRLVLGDTLAGLLDDLDSNHPGLKGRLITDEGGLHRFVNVYVNDEDVRFLGALDAKVNSGDTVTILPAVAGG